MKNFTYFINVMWFDKCCYQFWNKCGFHLQIRNHSFHFVYWY